MVESLAEMQRKVRLLRDMRSVNEGNVKRSSTKRARKVSSLYLGAPTELDESLPAGLRELYRIAGNAMFGEIMFFRPENFHAQPPIDMFGEIVRNGSFAQIGSVGEQTLLLDMKSGAVAIYDFLYFRHGYDDGFVVECSDVPAFVSTVALGPAYRLIYGPPELWQKPWWKKDEWFAFLTGLDFLA